MNTQQILQAIALAEAAAGPLISLASHLRASSGLSDEQLLAEAEKVDAETRDAVKAHLARVNG
jgi:hypothetical protein